MLMMLMLLLLLLLLLWCRVLVECGADCYRVSVRAPLDNKTGADKLCRQFDSGGGRKAAAGINQLKHQDLAKFTEYFFKAFV